MKDDVKNRRFVGPPRSSMDFGWMKRAAKAIDSLLNGLGENIEIIYSDSAVRFKATAAGMIYINDWTSKLAAVGIKPQDVFTYAGSAFVCILPNPGIANPPSATSKYWKQLGTDGGSRLVKIKGIANDFVNAVDWDGTTEGTTIVKVAKPVDMRINSALSRTYGGFTDSAGTVHPGVTVNYVYSDSNTRKADDGTVSEFEVLLEPYRVNDIITAAAISPHSGVIDTPADGGNPATYINLIEADSARKWARRYIQ